MAAKFKAGDIVKMKSGGPRMTVEELDVGMGERTIRCTWFSGSKHESGFFSPNAIVKAPEDKPTK